MFAWQAAAVVRLAQELEVTQTPLGQVAPAGHASTGIQVQAFAVPDIAGPLKVTPLGVPLQASAVV
jgi:hypothetical protein